jgi:hypothetical protein
MGEKRNAYRLLVGKLEGKRPLGRPRHRWVDNIRMFYYYFIPTTCFGPSGGIQKNTVMIAGTPKGKR